MQQVSVNPARTVNVIVRDLRMVQIIATITIAVIAHNYGQKPRSQPRRFL